MQNFPKTVRLGSISAALSCQVYPPLRGRSAGSFPEQQLVIEPTVRPVCDNCKCFHFFMPSRAFFLFRPQGKITKRIGIEKIYISACWLPAENVGEANCLTAFFLRSIGREDSTLALIGYRAYCTTFIDQS